MATVMEQAGKRILAKVVDDAAASDPDRRFAVIPKGPELSDGLQTITMKQLANATNFCCNWIEKTIGLPAQSHETLAYMASNDLRYCFFLLACQKLGYQAFFPSMRNSDEAHTHLLKVIGVTKFFTSAERHGRVLEIQSFTPGIEVFEVPSLTAMLAEGDFGSYPFPKTFAEAEDDTAVIIHSSGTTGLPKPVYLTNGFFSTMDAVPRMEWPADREPAFLWQDGEKDLVLSIAPFFHLMGMIGLIFTVFHKTAVLIGPEKPPSVAFLTELIKMGKPTTAVLPPSVLEDLVHDDDAVACIKEMRAIYFGGAPMASETGNRLRKYTKVVTVLGSSEAGWVQALVPKNPDDWVYFEWHPQAGVVMEPVGEDLYEMVLKRQENGNRDFHGIFHTFPKADTYRTKDLFTPHPTTHGLWKFYGRRDDVIVLSNGEKFNPVTMETMIEGHPLVSKAVVVGQGRFQAALLIEPSKPEMDAKVLVDEIWPSVQEANQTIAQHGRVMKNHIGIGSKDKPFKRTPKGSTQRQATVREYYEEIAAIYAAGLEAELEDHLPESLDQATVRDYVHRTIARVLEQSDMPVDQNLYTTLGLDSLMTIQISRMLQKGIQMHEPDVKADLLNPQTIYGNPTVEQLSQVVCDILAGKAGEGQTSINREEKIQGLVDKYTADLPIRDENIPQSTNAPTTVILTGSTGSLGTYLLNSLLATKSVTKIYCLNRSDAAQRQKKGLEEKGLHIDDDGWKKLEFLQASFGEPRFGLDEAKYQELLESVDTIIHNAWKVDFNQTVESFEETHIRGVRRFIDFSLQSNAHLHFVSSISAVGAWTPAMGPSVPEVPIDDCAVVLAQGYGESKHVGERICLEASRRSRVATTIYRVGQIAGPTSPSGQWNPHEWLPTIIATSKALGKVPNRLGAMAVDWTPVDTLASIMTELVNTRHGNRSLDLCTAFHLTNPSTVPWSSLIPAIQEKYSGVEPVDLAEWVGELEKIEKPTAADVAQKPGLKLLDFYKSLLSEKSLVVELEVKRTQEASATMRTLEPISVALMSNWLQQWRF
ncbi:hypothetical protein N7474_003941 [Penicillium riverlandense]|uniref:uncharacterized protein n=1 Tax=Penicillium riverlandense TaxID=1903569 RepID=UPI002547B3AD|nr:uncharacterized protein N7474_003941 [Penicillium riverlandense]KAJ5818350.1 hypothetical protein N7474_003941 [Penicillium riverlandense]